MPVAPRARPSAWGVAHVPEDRTGMGSAPNLSHHRQPDDEELPRARPSRVAGSSTCRRPGRAAEDLKSEYRVAAPAIDTQARLLSGGNLQRLILAREIGSKPKLMVAVQPTRGLDVGAIETVHRLLLERSGSGRRDPPHLRGPRRDAGPGRPGRRHLRGPHHGHVRRPGRGHARDRAPDDRRRWRSCRPKRLQRSTGRIDPDT